MATYNWYFSTTGDDTTGSGTEASPWATLVKMKTEIDGVLSTDIVNLYLKRGDTWSVDTLVKKLIHGFEIETTNPIVNMNAYGSGAIPCINGQITDFSVAPVHDGASGPLRWSKIFKFSRENCSVSYIEFKQIYGETIELKDAAYFHLHHVYGHHFGCGIIKCVDLTTENTTIEHNLMHNGQELWRYGLRSIGWGAAIGFSSQLDQHKNNLVRYNVVYDIFGEGINNAGGITEYNLVGDTYSTGIHVSPHNYDASDTIARYNLVIMSGTSDYQYPYPMPSMHNGRTSHNGIGFTDETLGGSNANADMQIYGNIIINRYYGIYAKNNEDPGTPFKLIRIYNNIVIDSLLGNYIIANPEECSEGYIYNNLSILYHRTTLIHGGHSNTFPHANWTIENNAFWTTGGSPTVDDGWTTGAIYTDPLLHGEEKATPVNWTGQSGATYFSDIKFDDIIPEAGSPLFGTGKTLGTGFEDTFLTDGTNFTTLPDTETFVLADQSVPWDIGAYVQSAVEDILPYTRARGIMKPQLKFNPIGRRFK